MSLQEVEKKYKQAVKNYNLLINLPAREETILRAWNILVSYRALIRVIKN